MACAKKCVSFSHPMILSSRSVSVLPRVPGKWTADFQGFSQGFFRSLRSNIHHCLPVFLTLFQREIQTFSVDADE